jgi:PKD repeat protein
MAVAFRAAAAFASNSSGNPVISYPAGVASGDLLIIQYMVGNSATVATTPSGWTLLYGPVATSDGSQPARAYVYYRVAGGSEPGSVTFAHTGSSGQAGGIMSAYTGADTTTPINVSTTATTETSGTTQTAPSVTTTVGNTRLLHMYWITGNTTTTQNAADTERYDVVWAAVFETLEVADKAQAATGATGTSAATYAAAVTGGLAATIAVAPAAAATIPVADFTGTPTSGTEPLSVAFTDTSTNTPTSWAWTFGDGGTSTSQNPSHTYTTAGTYTVALVATNSAGSNTKTRTGYITVADQPRPIRINTSQGWADIGDATSFVSGTGTPTAAVGATGAIYLDVTSGLRYGPKAAGAWPGTPIAYPASTPADATTSAKGIVQLAGDLTGTAALPQLKVPYGTTLPASPADGQEAILVDSTTNPSYQWRFRYNAGSSSAYKWEYVGGTDARLTQGSGNAVINSGGYWGSGYYGLYGYTYTSVPHAGDYLFRGAISLYANGATTAGTCVVIPAAAGALISGPGIQVTVSGNSAQLLEVAVNYLSPGNGAGSLAGFGVQTPDNAVWQYWQCCVSYIPVRVS